MPNRFSRYVKVGKALLADLQRHRQEVRATLRGLLLAAERLYHLGYLTLDAASDPAGAVSLFQERYGLLADGLLDARTLSVLNLPRCGCPDIVRPIPEHAEYAALRQRVEFMRANVWRKRALRYYIASYVPGVEPQRQRAIIAEAWRSWTRHCQIEVEATNDPRGADITISTGRGSRSQFDGAGGTLAWAYLPPGDNSPLLMRFDLDEAWEIAIKLLNVAAHEFGHLLGLDHSQRRSALMAPTYNEMIAVPQSIDDIPRIVELYGVRAAAPQPTPPTWNGSLTLEIAGATSLRVNGREVPL